jgi:hypothetical protein
MVMVMKAVTFQAKTCASCSGKRNKSAPKIPYNKAQIYVSQREIFDNMVPPISTDKVDVIYKTSPYCSSSLFIFVTLEVGLHLEPVNNFPQHLHRTQVQV